MRIREFPLFFYFYRLLLHRFSVACFPQTQQKLEISWLLWRTFGLFSFLHPTLNIFSIFSFYYCSACGIVDNRHEHEPTFINSCCNRLNNRIGHSKKKRFLYFIQRANKNTTKTFTHQLKYMNGRNSSRDSTTSIRKEANKKEKTEKTNAEKKLNNNNNNNNYLLRSLHAARIFAISPFPCFTMSDNRNTYTSKSCVVRFRFVGCFFFFQTFSFLFIRKIS